jgi:deoxyinosine 3'endonuclease (endonuclease V)
MDKIKSYKRNFLFGGNIDPTKIINELAFQDKDKNKTFSFTYTEPYVIDMSKIEELTQLWREEQTESSKRLYFDASFTEDKINLVGGLDITFLKNSSRAIVCMVIYNYTTMRLDSVFVMECDNQIPYISSFLGQREVPAYMTLIEYIRLKYPTKIPDLLIVDGNGVWHPRRCGAATQLSLLSGIPCIGVAKSYLIVGDLPGEKQFQEEMKTAIPNQGDFKLIFDTLEIDTYPFPLGYVYNATGNTKKLIYINVGNGIELELARKIVIDKFSKFRNNEAVRQADLISREIAKRRSKEQMEQ